MLQGSRVFYLYRVELEYYPWAMNLSAPTGAAFFISIFLSPPTSAPHV
jgi:hypothetical protein